MAGRRKFCLAYSRRRRRLCRPRRPLHGRDRRGRTAGRCTGLTVEDFGLVDNLMMIHALELHGCPLVTPAQMPIDVWHDLAAFEACVRMAAARLIAP
ncbi:hypothetical protein ACQ5SK_32780 [Bradyrhizobium japonicum]